MRGTSIKAVAVKVYGRVQRVGYRRYVLDMAQELGVTGYVKNLPDGSVEINAQGDEAKISQFLDKIKTPPIGVVREIKVEEVTPEPEMREFKIIYGDIAEELQEGFGAMQTIFTQYWNEFRDYRQEFREFKEESLKISRETLETSRQALEVSRQTLEVSKQTLKVSRQTLEVSRQTLHEVKELRKDLKTILDERISRMEKDIAEIKARIGLT